VKFSGQDGFGAARQIGNQRDFSRDFGQRDIGQFRGGDFGGRQFRRWFPGA
jgi:hypothetical protein